MQDSTEEIARRVLEGVLRRLETGPPRPPAPPASDQAAGILAGGPPVIVILLGDQRTAHGEASAAAVQASCGCQNNSPAIPENSLQSLHAGLERFALPEGEAVSAAPRTCFMEPDRLCVGSGACEMRGY